MPQNICSFGIYTKVQIDNNFEIHKSSHILPENSNWLVDIQKSLRVISSLTFRRRASYI
jgi:hypothetical protein